LKRFGGCVLGSLKAAFWAAVCASEFSAS